MSVCSGCTCIFVCSRVRTYVPRVHRRVLTCAHFCVPTRHVFVSQENTCLLSDEYSCVSVFLRALRSVCSSVQYTCVGALVHMCVCVHVCACVSPTCTHICVFTCAHMCGLIRHVYVFQVNTCLLSDEHSCVCVFHVYTYVCSNWTGVCVPGEHTVVIG